MRANADACCLVRGVITNFSGGGGGVGDRALCCCEPCIQAANTSFCLCKLCIQAANTSFYGNLCIQESDVIFRAIQRRIFNSAASAVFISVADERLLEISFSAAMSRVFKPLISVFALFTPLIAVCVVSAVPADTSRLLISSFKLQPSKIYHYSRREDEPDIIVVPVIFVSQLFRFA